MRSLGAFVLVFLQAQIKSTCISHNGFCILSMRQCTIKQLLDEVFVISGKIKVSASVISLVIPPRLITLAKTLIIPDITKASSSNCLKLMQIASSLFQALNSVAGSEKKGEREKK